MLNSLEVHVCQWILQYGQSIALTSSHNDILWTCILDPFNAILKISKLSVAWKYTYVKDDQCMALLYFP